MASRLAYTQAKLSNQAEQLSPRAAPPDLCLSSKHLKISLPSGNRACFPDSFVKIGSRPGFRLFSRTTASKSASRPEIRLFSRTALFSAMQRGGEWVQDVFCLPQEEGYIITIMVDFYEGDLPGVYRG